MEPADLLRTFPELGVAANKGICIPLVQRIPKTERVQKILDLPCLQRLRGIRQLSFAHMIYPGATHTRLEHSLGVYARVCRYVQALSCSNDYPLFRQRTSEREVAAVLLASLLHDAGHYPFAHSFEELQPTLSRNEVKHDELAARILLGDLPQLASTTGALAEAVSMWGIGPADVAAVILGRPQASMTLDPDWVPVLHSLLDGPLDADKVDYLQRDSLHCGNPVGLAVDDERLISSLVLRNLTEGLGIRERGLAAAQSLFHARFSMFLTIYWHRTNRAMVRMFSEALKVLHDRAHSELEMLFTQELFASDDERFLERVERLLRGHDDRIADHLVAPLRAAGTGRSRVYRRLTTIAAEVEKFSLSGGENSEDPHFMICVFYDGFIRQQSYAWKWILFEHLARKIVIDQARGLAEPYDVLIDVPDPRFEAPKHTEGVATYPPVESSFRVYGQDKQPIPVGRLLPLFATFMDAWRINARKVRIFVHDNVHKQLFPARLEIRNAILQIARIIFDTEIEEEAIKKLIEKGLY